MLSNSQDTIAEVTPDLDDIQIIEDDEDEGNQQKQMGMSWSQPSTGPMDKIINVVGEIMEGVGNAVDGIMEDVGLKKLVDTSTGNSQNVLDSSNQQVSFPVKCGGSRSRKGKVAASRSSQERLKSQLEIDMVDQPTTGTRRSASEGAIGQQARRSHTPLDRLKNTLVEQSKPKNQRDGRKRRGMAKIGRKPRKGTSHGNLRGAVTQLPSTPKTAQRGGTKGRQRVRKGRAQSSPDRLKRQLEIDMVDQPKVGGKQERGGGALISTGAVEAKKGHLMGAAAEKRGGGRVKHGGPRGPPAPKRAKRPRPASLMKSNEMKKRSAV